MVADLKVKGVHFTMEPTTVRPGVRVAFLAYTEFTNGIPLPHPWSVNLAGAARILADAHQALLDGAQVVIVNLHWGDEYVPQPSSFQVALAKKLTRSADITAIVGQHVHVAQPIRIINGKPVVFGEGNLISNQTSACCPAASQDGMIVLLTIAVDSRGARVTVVRYVPVWVRHPDYVVLPAGVAWRTDPADAAALRASYERTVAVAGRGPRIQPKRTDRLVLCSSITRICRNEGVTDTHIYAPNGIITHGLLTLSAITAQPFLAS